GLSRTCNPETGAFFDADSGAARRRNGRTANAAPVADRSVLDQISVSATDSWQVFRPLLLIYGFDYSRFVGDMNDRDSVLPRLAVQYSPSSRVRVNAAATPVPHHSLPSPQPFNSS